MEKENKLVKKVKRLIRRLGYPRWLHHFGPKKYEFYEHLVALLIRFNCRLSFRRVNQFMDMIGLRCPSKSALHCTSKKLGSNFWSRILDTTCGTSYLISIDSTGLARTNPSYHYLKRIDGKVPKIPVKVSIAFDTKKKKFKAARIRVTPAHDMKDATYLVNKSDPKVLVADKAYDANSLHKYCRQNKIRAHIPIRKKGKPVHGALTARRLAAKKFRIRTYHRREIGESGNGSLKRKYGGCVFAKKARTIRTEVYGRMACHNIFLFYIWRFGTEPISRIKTFRAV